MSKGRVLVVEDEPDMLENCRRILERAGFDVALQADAARARDSLAATDPDLVLTDLVMPGVDGLAILEAARAHDPDLPVILFTAYATVESAVEAIRKGAFDYIAKPFSAGQLTVAVERGLRQRALVRDNRRLGLLVADSVAAQDMVGASEPMRRLRQTIQKVAEGDASVLITGESGTGKELVAKSIHLHSPRKEGAFVPVDCVALPETLLEGELFGHEKGAFTGAHSSKPGLLEIAHRGTLFLDELGRLPVPTQTKLLRVLQEREFRRLGSNRMVRVDFRVLAATNEDLHSLMSRGLFREDLYYRLDVVRIQVAPLRERREDIALLSAHFLRKHAADAPKVNGIGTGALRLLESRQWPGNVRELENAIRRAMVLAEKEHLDEADFPFMAESRRGTAEAMGEAEVCGLRPLKAAREEALRDLDRNYLTTLLERSGGNVSAAAQAAGVSRRTLHRMIRRLGIRHGEGPAGDEPPAD